MNIIAICGSGQKNGKIASMVKKVLEGAQSQGHATKLIYLSEHHIKPCYGCWNCYTAGTCAVNDDCAELYRHFEQADAVILGTPIYEGNVSGMLKNFIDRSFGCALDKMPGSHEVKNGSFMKKLQFMSAYLAPKKAMAGKKYLFVISANKPSPYIHFTGDLRNTLATLKTFVASLNGIVRGKIVYLNAFFGDTPKRWDAMLEHAYQVGKNLL